MKLFPKLPLFEDELLLMHDKHSFFIEPGKIAVDDYIPAEGKEWDVDEWEASQGFIYFGRSKSCWKDAYRAARILAQGKKIRIPSGEVLCLPCKLTISSPAPNGRAEQ